MIDKNKIIARVLTTFYVANLISLEYSFAIDDKYLNESSVIVDKEYKIENRLYIDSKLGEINNTDIEISGWTLNTSGIKKVNIYVDGEYYGEAKTGLSRPDVDAAFPGYPEGANSGFSYIIEKDMVAPGNHTIKIESVGMDGTIQYVNKVVYMKKLENKIYIDTESNQINDKEILIKGWSLNASGIKKVNVYVDGEYHGEAEIGLSRPDVDAAFPGYPEGENSGYQYIIDKNSISPGSHNIKVESVGNDGSRTIQSINMEVIKLENKVYIDSPDYIVDNKDIEISGWSLNASGVKEVKIYVDGIYKGNAEIGKSRPDVDEVFPGYPDGANSGYTYCINKNTILPGKHEIKVETIGNDKSITSQIKNIEVVKLDNKMCIDSPNDLIRNEDIKLSGWSLNASGVKEVKIYVDGIYKGNAEIGKSRPDVDVAYPGYPSGDKSGFGYIINKDSISPGIHKIKVESIGNDGSINTQYKTINILKPEGKIYIDKPRGNTILNDKNMEISGWSLNSSGIKRIKIYVDGKYYGDAELGLSRPDVDIVYPGYPNGDKSGYTYNLNTLNLGFGKHTIKVEAIGNDGSVYSTETYINDLKIIEYKKMSYSFDTQLKKQIAKNSDMKFYNGKYVKASEEDIKYYIDYNNFTNQSDMYQFLRLDIFKDLNSESELNNHLSKVLKNGTNNPLWNQGQAFIDASKQYNLDPIYLVAHTLLETGYGTSNLAKGYEVVLDDNGNAVYYDKVINGKTYSFVKIKDSTTPQDTKTVKVYNFFGIGAIDQAATAGGVTAAYKNGWTTYEKAIKGAAKWISDGYINSSKFNQNTLYYMRWYYDTKNGNWHQYATDIGWAKKIANLMYEMSYMYSPTRATMIYELPRYTQNKILEFFKNLFE